jgi:cell wall-associated NlpC family hydrolase
MTNSNHAPEAPTRLQPGDHLSVRRRGYTHHGIYVGSGRVVHYSGEKFSKRDASVREVSLAGFLGGGSATVVRYGQRQAPEAIIAAARSKLGERQYSLVTNNCEHFATWCSTGRHHSEQVQSAVGKTSAVTGTAAATAGALGTVSAAGAVAGLGGAGIMSGLASVGGMVGAGAAGGVAMLAAAPAAVGVAASRIILADRPELPQAEREARHVGRVASTVAGAAGTAASVGAIAAAGSVAGLSAAGITSGLAAIGGTIGCGMAGGLALTVAAPVVLAVGLGAGAYKLARSFGGNRRG